MEVLFNEVQHQMVDCTSKNSLHLLLLCWASKDWYWTAFQFKALPIKVPAKTKYLINSFVIQDSNYPYINYRFSLKFSGTIDCPMYKGILSRKQMLQVMKMIAIVKMKERLQKPKPNASSSNWASSSMLSSSSTITFASDKRFWVLCMQEM